MFRNLLRCFFAFLAGVVPGKSLAVLIKKKDTEADSQRILCDIHGKETLMWDVAILPTLSIKK